MQHYACYAIGLILALGTASGQVFRPPILPPAAENSQPNAANPNLRLRTPRPDAPPKDFVKIDSITQESDGPIYHLRGKVVLETQDEILQADEVDYNEDTHEAEARGHVKYENFVNGDKLQCDHAKYNLDSETGSFFDVTGTSPAKIQSRPGILTTSNPFYFEGKWAERVEDRYILHDGTVTDCKVPKPWWTLTAPKFDIILNDRAIGYHAVFRLRGIPLFYSPAFYKSLKKSPRKTGFLTPSAGHSSLRGYFTGFGYYWAINRSYDLLYRGDDFTTNAFAHNVDFRGKVRPGTDFNFTLYGVNDWSGVVIGSTTNSQGVTTPVVQHQGGVQFQLDGRSDLGNGWEARGQLNYLSSFLFRQSFTYSFHEASFSESHSVGFVSKHWSDYALTFVADRDEEFQSVTPDDKIVIRKLPEVEFLGRTHQIWDRVLPLWFSFTSSAGTFDRTEPDFQTRQFVDRLDLNPEVTTAFHWKGFSLLPSFAIHETQYGSSFFGGHVSGQNLLRDAREVRVEFIPPPLERIYKAPHWLGGEKMKHVIEPRVQYDYVTGIGTDFLRAIRFDDTDLLSNDNELRLSLANRLYVKNKDGNVNEIVSWEISQSRYFDPTFGGAVVAGQRNVVQSVADLTGYSFLDGPRNYSPVVSALRVQQRIGLEWRTDYDPRLHQIVNSSLSADVRFSQYFVSVGHAEVREDPVLAPNSNQFRVALGYGSQTRKGWNAAFSLYYDYKQGITQFATGQVTYNTDCCGISVQYRRFNFGTRDETQFRVAFAVSNIGSFGTLRKQERIF
jgi:LPS-assembly protein